ncbi:MAG TPA: hypothetical protein VLA74_06850, partial [Nitrososphaeraceae archaeon]|nr:hypothetical protein [Nitrososphaeraceae archaeon]
MNESLSQNSTIINYNGWHKIWDIIIQGKFIDHNKRKYKKHVPGEIKSKREIIMEDKKYIDLFLYDRSSGTAAFLSTDGYGNTSVIQEHHNWSKTWDIITTGCFSPN